MTDDWILRLEADVKIEVFKTKAECGTAAADRGAEILKEVIAVKGRASFIVATGASQFDFMDALCRKDGIAWHKTVMYHLDEYIGISEEHPASFRRYLKERLVDLVNPGTVFLSGARLRIRLPSAAE